MLRVLQAGLQQYVNWKLPGIQAGFRKGRGIRDQIANIHCVIEKAAEFQKNIYFCFFDYIKAFDCVDHNKMWKFLRKGNIRPSYLPPVKPVQFRKKQLDPDMEQWTGSELGAACVRAVYCHPGYFTYMQNTSCEMPGWMNHKLKSRLPGEMSITSDM